PHLVAAMSGVDVHGHAPADVRRGLSPEKAAGPGVAELRAVWVPRTFVDVEDFEARVIGVDVREVERIAVPQARGVKPLAVIVDGAGAVDDLVPAVAVDVAHAQVVVPLAAIGAMARRPIVAIEGPDPSELPVAPVPGDEHRAGVVAAAH